MAITSEEELKTPRAWRGERCGGGAKVWSWIEEGKENGWKVKRNLETERREMVVPNILTS